MRWLLPIFLIGVGVGGFFLITQPIYGEIKLLQEEADAYGQALDNSASLQKERDRLTTKYNSFAAEDILKLEKMLPNTVDNIQLILEIQEEASKRGIIDKNVEFEPEQFAEQTAEDVVLPEGDTAGNSTSRDRATTTRRSATLEDNKDYEAFELEFSVEGSYDDFVSFMKLMERSLRLVDINSISFTPGTSEKDKVYTDDYKYLFRINTYRLRD
mgnify:CR=1 FL=1